MRTTLARSLLAICLALTPTRPAMAGGTFEVPVQPPTPGTSGPPPLFDPRSEPITEGAIPSPEERAAVLPKLDALRAARHRLLLGDRHSDAQRQELLEEAYLSIATLGALSPDGDLVMRAIGEVEATAGTLITLGDRARGRQLLSVIKTKLGQLLAAKPQNPVLRFLDRSATMKVALLATGNGGPMPPSGGDPAPPDPTR